MEVFRLNRKKYVDGLSGRGAAIRGARWNSRGVEMVYTASSRALAMAEVLVHLSTDLIPNDFEMLSIQVPDDVLIQDLDEELLPSEWNSFSKVFVTQRIGDQFVREGKSCCLKVPSVVVPGDYNFLLNPVHPDFPKVKIVASRDFPFDTRFF